jgi:hypothetical protein
VSASRGVEALGSSLGIVSVACLVLVPLAGRVTLWLREQGDG